MQHGLHGDRKRLSAVRALTLVAVLLLAGCAKPAGTDGDLVNGWAAQPSASYTVPAVGTCVTGGGISAFEPSAAPVTTVDCAQEHTAEVVLVGTFSGPAAAAAAPPAWDSDPSRAAYAECSKAATAYVGADWHTGRLFPWFSLPKEAAWKGGARQYVCGLAEAEDDLFAPKARTGSLKDGLKDPKPLALTCVRLDGSDVSPEGFYRTVEAVTPVGCTEPHDTEFVGTWTAAAGAYPDAKRLNELASDGCYGKIAAFLGLSQLQLYERGDVYTFWTGLTANQWKLGDRVAHCFLNVSSKSKLTASLKDLGTKPLPAA
ncbi:septum formation family protein [Dactylosporangium sp. AC04546]|uniref:septum formation family protein n=1 Tax=Dactylosporangium sp. AC04546 TaxID=2862460 RepID=UPI001EDD36A9|nr:septum formation family protein [Dactylosporangium sp. AC04546]WVK85886.1 septum formation family protein [Dactylosporangium sp. AC04546]